MMSRKELQSAASVHVSAADISGRGAIKPRRIS